MEIIEEIMESEKNRDNLRRNLEKDKFDSAWLEAINFVVMFGLGRSGYAHNCWRGKNNKSSVRDWLTAGQSNL